jgi:hypothetical protein
MTVVEWLEVVAGIALVCVMLYDVFSSVVVPRQVSPAFRTSALVVRRTWALWRAYAIMIKDEDQREDFLARFAPGILIGLLIIWLIGLLLGYGLIFYGLRSHMQPPLHSYIDAIYFAGTSLITIGYGDIVATDMVGRLFALAAGATGLGLFALLISFIYSIFGSFQNREVFVVMMGGRAGAPPSGVTLLETVSRYKIFDDFAQSMREGERWAASVLESHLAYPILAYFRSSHDDESWIGTLGAMLDASTMLITLTDNPLVGRAKLLHVIGVHLVRDLTRYFHVVVNETAGIERSEFDQACAQLKAAGWEVRCDDAAWQSFSELRMQYAGPLNEMAKFWMTPPARWIGDRSEIGKRMMHAAS